MPYTIIGLGQCGCNILDTVFSYPHVKKFINRIAVDSTVTNLSRLKYVKKENWLGISTREEICFGNVTDFEERITGGFGKNPQHAYEIGFKQRNELEKRIKDHE